MALCAVGAACLFGLLPASASAARSVTFVPSFSAYTHLGEGGSFTAALTFSGSEYHGEVAPLTGLTLHLPAGITFSSAGFPTCSKERLEQIGLIGCPEGSIAGVGSFSAIVWFPEPEEEPNGEVRAVFGPGGVLYFVTEGRSPVLLEDIMEAHLVSDSPPYGQELDVQVPVMETDPHLPAVSITSLTLNLGSTWEIGGEEVSSVTLPSTCPGSFAWGADASFVGEASEPIGTTTTACPLSGMRAITSTALTVSDKTPKENVPVTYTATVTPTSGGAPPTGTVNFFTYGCTAQPLIQGISSSTATCQVSYSDPFSFTERAIYSGSETDSGSLSHSLTVVVDGTEEPLAKEEPPAKHEEPSAPPSTSSTSPPPNSSAPPATISSSQIVALLNKQLVPSGKVATIASLLKSGGLSASFTAPEAGTLSVQWYELPTGVKLAKRGKAKPVLVASGQTSFAVAGTGKLTIRLTAVGKRLLKGARQLKLEAKGTFTPRDGGPIDSVMPLVVRR
jgi:hypothetical protein